MSVRQISRFPSWVSWWSCLSKPQLRNKFFIFFTDDLFSFGFTSFFTWWYIFFSSKIFIYHIYFFLTNNSMVNASSFWCRFGVLWTSFMLLRRNLVWNESFWSLLSRIFWSQKSFMLAMLVIFAVFVASFAGFFLGLSKLSFHIVIIIEFCHIFDLLIILLLKRGSNILFEFIDIALSSIHETTSSWRPFLWITSSAAFDLVNIFIAFDQ